MHRTTKQICRTPANTSVKIINEKGIVIMHKRLFVITVIVAMALSACGEKKENVPKNVSVTATTEEESTKALSDLLPIEANTAFLTEKGIPEEDARKIAEIVDHGAPNGLIEKIEGYNPDSKDIKLIVHMATGKSFYVTVLEENERNATISDYKNR